MPATKRDYYDVLGIGRESNGGEIKRAFRIRARVLHPDVSEDPDATEKFAELAEAYDVLSKSTSRLLYDRFGYRGRGEFAAVEPAATQLLDFLSKSGESGRRRRVAEIEVTQYEAERGTSVTVEYVASAACRACSGSGATPGSTPRLCSRCGGRGRTRHGSTLAGDRVLQIDTCLKCAGRGKIVTRPCETCDGNGRRTSRKRAEVRVPAGAVDGQRVDVGDGSLMYAVVRVRALPDAFVVRCGAALGLVLACLFLALVIHL
jgi:molecular chaperone DnaJ